MSFWSKLGLADAAAVAGLKAEILSLRQENEKLHEIQSKHTLQLCNCTTSEVAKISCRLEDQLKSLQPKVSAIIENQSSFQEHFFTKMTLRGETLAQIVELLNEIKSVQDQTSSKLDNVFHGITSLQDAVHIQNNLSTKMADQVDSQQSGLQKILSETQSAAEDIAFLKKYTDSLWEAMKLVWINDLLDDLNSQG